MKKRTHEEYLSILKEKNISHIPVEVYINKRTKILHKCAEKSHLWSSTPDSILQKYGCPTCNNLSQTKTHKEYENEIMKLNLKLFPVEKYVNKETPILHECWEGHTWKVRPSGIISKHSGCPVCAVSGFNPLLPATLYFFKFVHNNTNYYKIGITNISTKSRHSYNWYKNKIEIIWELKFSKGKDARELEKSLLDKYKEFKVNTGALKSGNTETLSIEIFKPLL